VPIAGVYEPSALGWVREQVETYERTRGEQAALDKVGLPIVVVTMLGRRTGSVRKIGLMRVERDGRYALVGSIGGAPKDPSWVHNLRAAPDLIMIQDGPDRHDYRVREVLGDERAQWWDLAVRTYPPYETCQQRTTRVIPVFVAERIG
jgi:deazaflavin-dependent oxidoreductase (nitroreductase family)